MTAFLNTRLNIHELLKSNNYLTPMKNIFLFFSMLLLFPVLINAQTELKLFTSTGTINGTLQFPAVYKRVPLVILIAGSGPTDRNGNNEQMENNCLKMLADSLESAGIASLRYDKRGIAASKAAGMEESDLRFENYVDDAAAWIQMLRKDMRFSKIIVAGHSEGSLIGMIAVDREHADGFISIAGAGSSADIILKQQLAAQPEQIKQACYKVLFLYHSVQY